MGSRIDTFACLISTAVARARHLSECAEKPYFRTRISGYIEIDDRRRFFAQSRWLRAKAGLSEGQMAEIQTGDFVRQIGKKTNAGRVLEIRDRGGRKTIKIQFPNGSRKLPMDTVELVPDEADTPSELLSQGQLSGHKDFKQRIAHVRLSGNMSDVFYSMEATDTDFYAHQFKPVVKMLDSPSGNLLIADEVGLGKTIEAGLIWTELAARFKYNRLLVICPKVLCDKWRRELQNKFDVPAQIYDAKGLLELMKSPYSQRAGFAAVCGYQGIRPRPKEKRTGRPVDQLTEVLEEAQGSDKLVDLLVIDEAHHMRNRGTQTNELGSIATGVSQHTAMLSATPINLHNRDLHSLLRLVDDMTFRDETALEQIIRANVPLVAARDGLLSNKPFDEVDDLILRASRTPILRNAKSLPRLRRELLDKGAELRPSDRARIAAGLEKVNLLSNAINRTRRRDVEEFRVVRHVHAYRSVMTSQERDVYDRVTKAILDYADENDLPVGFLTVMPQRMLASSLPAALSHWRKAEAAFDCEDEDEDEDEDVPDEEETDRRPLARELGRVSSGLPDPKVLERQDTKFAEFLRAIREQLQSKPNQKIVVFSTFRSTLKYLERRLHENSIPTLLLYGATKDRGDVQARFEDDLEIPILLASEVGSEGIDLQFAQTVVNYDLPWNPMRVEQRIGRIDRLGQTAEAISVLNLLHENTVDDRIYSRLHDRLGLCKTALGGFEEILGREIKKLTTDLLSGKLTESEQDRRIADTEQAIQNQRQHEEELEREASSLIAHGDYVLGAIRDSRESKNWITENDIVDYIEFALGALHPGSEVRWLPEKSLVDISMTSDARHQYESWCTAMQVQAGSLARNASAVSFRVGKGEKRSRHPRLSPAHPLMRYLAGAVQEKDVLPPNAAAIQIGSSDCPSLKPGIYAGAVQCWVFGEGASSLSLAYGLVDCSTGELFGPDIAESIVSCCIASGSRWHSAVAEIDGEKTSELVDDDLGTDLDLRFHDEKDRRVGQIEDRIAIQLSALEHRSEERARIIEKQILNSPAGLVAANRTRLRNHLERTEQRRLEIKGQSVDDASYSDVSAFVLKVLP
ncbi:helicase-related protein [Tropicimonas sp. TH_r6]|uniref:helicase-related protein n=1 Tax=Tropicimonas sp. TH_r6 TaxID=3082085 RepID=UPI002952A682|nr:helicase-related protein [Tropicimonas sp. TH_r6]MDV7144746.1 helicase-related protein [Tropicimonas sp. TH_r6]